MLGEVIAPDAGAVIGFDQREPVGIKLAERHARVVHVIEHAEFHEAAPLILRMSLSENRFPLFRGMR